LLKKKAKKEGGLKEFRAQEKTLERAYHGKF